MGSTECVIKVSVSSPGPVKLDILAAGPSLRRLEICPKGPYDLKISLAQSSTSASFASSFPWTVFYISTFACWPEDRWASRGSSFVAPLR